MKDFTIYAYKVYTKTIKSSFPILRFDEYFILNKKPERFCIIRHDVDRKPRNALKMAILENSMGISSTYYFRAKSHTFIPGIIKNISILGHEIGYHYESLSDFDGDIKKALWDFRKNLELFRKIVKIKTIAKHGRPLKRFDNLDIWKGSEYRKKLMKELNLLGEIYLDIDYCDISYISDTGRNWETTSHNIEDKVNSKIEVNFKNNSQLLSYLRNSLHSKLIFQIHPERWSDSLVDYYSQWLKDKLINLIKSFL